MAIAFERATEIVARSLASFRLGLDADDPFAFNEYEKLCAGHIVGALWGAKLLNTEGENWVTVDSMEIRAERERCAKIADSFTCGVCGMDGKAGAAIRSCG